MNTDRPDPAQTVYWRRDLPPLDGEPADEHTIEAASVRVAGRLAHGDEMWGRCYDDLMRAARERIEQEIRRLGGRYAYVNRESIDSKHDGATDEGWLHGRFDFVLYRVTDGPSA